MALSHTRYGAGALTTTHVDRPVETVARNAAPDVQKIVGRAVESPVDNLGIVRLTGHFCLHRLGPRSGFDRWLRVADFDVVLCTEILDKRSLQAVIGGPKGNGGSPGARTRCVDVIARYTA